MYCKNLTSVKITTNVSHKLFVIGYNRMAKIINRNKKKKEENKKVIICSDDGNGYTWPFDLVPIFSRKYKRKTIYPIPTAVMPKAPSGFKPNSS